MDTAAFPMMLNFTSQIPVPPLPSHKIFFKHSPSQAPAATSLADPDPLLLKTFVKEMEGPTIKKAPSLLEKHFQEQQLLQQKRKQQQEAEVQAKKQQQQQQQQQLLQLQLQQQHQQQQQQSPSSRQSGSPPTSASTPSTSTSTGDTKVSQGSPSPDAIHNPLISPSGDAGASVDPKYIQMVSRMAAYYQQRCQAILNYQQQRCQTWATSHRQKCQETVQAAMLVVAWYIRDRIGRRRRRQKHVFRRGLRKNNSTPAARRVPKGEIVRKWVMDIPDAALSPNNGIRECNMDKEEMDFDIEKEVTPDKDSQLFTIADQMIRSQLAKIDVPLLGALNMDDSESESESDDDDGDADRGGGRCYYSPEDYEMEDDEEEDGDVEGDDGYEYEEGSEDLVEDEASQEAIHGTGKGSLKRKRSESTSDVVE